MQIDTVSDIWIKIKIFVDYVENFTDGGNKQKLAFKSKKIIKYYKRTYFLNNVLFYILCLI